jgi:hypothetical protein|tara:strand:+ start:238 stop:888 length:651 start_codon:yes stop_codon:yes gene_type:complete
MVLEMKTQEQILDHLREYGWAVIENYWSREKCEEALEQLHNIPKEVLEGPCQGGDYRCQHSNRYMKASDELLNDSFIQGIADGYSKCNLADRVLAGIVPYVEGSDTDSGGGWHIDADWIDKQFKCFIYLNDVGEKNGPFTFIQKSKEVSEKISTHDNLRVSEEDIMESVNPEDIIEFVAPAGTCILADTTFLHRGKQIEEGVRYTITTYFYENNGE